MAAQVPSPPTGLDDPTQRRYRGSGKITDYEVTNAKLGEGTFGVVSKARSRRTGAIVALKKILMHNEKDGFPITALREVKLLKMLSHPNILRLEEMAVERTDEKGVGSKMGKKRATLYMVTPYMDHDLSGMLTNPDIQLKEAQIKCYMLQLLEGLRYLHDSHILHRDMKAANILISNRGLLQIADFGLARHYEGPTPRAGQGNGEAVRDYTSLVVTRWYRPPELLLTLKRYTPAIDMWGVGCVFGEMFERKPILEGRTDIDQCHRIFALVGSPTDQTMPGWKELQGCEGTNTWESKKGDIDQRFGRWLKPEGLNLLKSLLCLDWRRRVNAIDALQHEYFKTAPLPLRPEDLPRYEDSHELDARRRGHEQKRALPPAPQGGTVGMGPDEWTGSGPGYPVNGYGYDSRPPPRGYGRDRGPPGAPQPRGYDDRRGPPAPPDAGRREPAWRRDARPPPINGHALPPRPDTSLPPRPNGPLPDRGPPPAARDGRDARPRAGGGGADIDTYIPNYSDRPPPPREREGHRDAPPDRYDRGRRGSRDNAYRDDDVPPPRAVYRDPDAPGRGPDPYRDRDRNGGPGAAYAEQRRTRSRSPAGRMRNDDDRRERLQNRDRDLYRR